MVRLQWFKLHTYEYDRMTRGWSPEQHGVVVMILLLMAQDDRPGYLTARGQAASTDLIAKRIGVRHELLNQCLTDSIAVGMFDTDRDGIVRCPWMVKDYQAFLAQSKGGRKSRRVAAKLLSSTLEGTPSLSPSQSQFDSGGPTEGMASGGESARTKADKAALEAYYAEFPSGNPPPGKSEGPDDLTALVHEICGGAVHTNAMDVRDAREAAKRCGHGVMIECLRWGIDNGEQLNAAISRAKTIAGGKGFAAGKAAKKGADDDLADLVKKAMAT